MIKNTRIIIITVSSIITATILCYSWINNTYDLDILPPKRASLEDQMFSEVKASNDINFVKQKYYELNDIRIDNQQEKNSIVSKNMRSFVISFLFLFVSIIFLLIELYKRRKKIEPKRIN